MYIKPYLEDPEVGPGGGAEHVLAYSYSRDYQQGLHARGRRGAL